MSDKAIENALRHRDDLAKKINQAQQQIEEWKRSIAETDAFIATWRRFAGEDDGPPPPPPPDDEAAAPRRRKATKNSKKEEVAEFARQLITDAGRPLSRAELFDGLTSLGLTIEGTDPQMVLSTMLWRMKDSIVRLEKGGYWLAEKPFEAEHYYADAEFDAALGSTDDAPPSEIVENNNDDDDSRS